MAEITKEDVDDVFGDEVATTEREVKQYPICPKGLHKGTCIKAELKEQEFEGRKSTVLALTWELETTYEDTDQDGNKVQRKHKVFDRLGLYYGPKARLHQAFKELTGEEIAPLVKQKKFKRDGKDYIQETFQFKAFEEMKAEILVKHKEGKADPSKIYANIGEYSCNAELQKQNAALVFDGSEK